MRNMATPSKSPIELGSTDEDDDNNSGVEISNVSYEPDGSAIFDSAHWSYYKDENSKLPIVISFSELIDNSLSATVTNSQLGLSRDISLRYYHNEAKESDGVFMIADNGIGLNVETLTFWATYKLSKDKRRDREMAIHESATPVRGGTRNSDSSIKGEVPGFLNGNLSKFGAGGKEAAFFVGKTVIMMTKFRGESRVHTIELSIEDFERKKAAGESVYKGVIKTRDVGDSSGVNNKIIKWIIENEEAEKKSFAHCIVTDIRGEEVETVNRISTMVKKEEHFELTCRLLTDVYHYYLHGPKGNYTDNVKLKEQHMIAANRKINLDFKVFKIKRDFDDDYFTNPYRERNLKTEDPDNLSSRTVLIRSAAQDPKAKLEFRGEVTVHEQKGKSAKSNGPIKKFEGVLYYYPYHYDRETFPETDYNADRADYDPAVDGRGPYKMFDCYWNGRFVPTTKFDGFDFMVKDKNSRSKIPPGECYNRVAGVMFFNDAWQVTQNKQTFAESLSEKLDLKSNPSVSGPYNTTTLQVKVGVGKDAKWIGRGMDSIFKEWLINCHKLDKKIVFSDYVGVGSRPELTKANQYPWTKFKTIEWDDNKSHRTLTTDELVLVKTGKTAVCRYPGKVVHFWAKGDYTHDIAQSNLPDADKNMKGKVCAEGGEVVMKTEPAKDLKTFPLAQIDKSVDRNEILKIINQENEKMPASIDVSFVDWNNVPAIPLKDGDEIEVAQDAGPFCVDVMNKTGKSCKGLIPGMKKKLVIQLSLYQLEDQFGGKMNHKMVTHESNIWSSEYQYWFEKMNTWSKPGKYQIRITCTLGRKPGPKSAQGPSSADSDEDLDSTNLPSKVINFTVIPGPPRNIVCEWDKPIRIQVPFDFPFYFSDGGDNPILDTLSENNFDIKIISKQGRFELNSKVIKLNPSTKIPEMVAKFTLLSTTDKFKWAKDDHEQMKLVEAELEVKNKNSDLLNKIYSFPRLALNFRTQVGKPNKMLVFPDKDEGNIEIENGTLPMIGVKVLDACHNLVTRDIEQKLDNGIAVEFYDDGKKISSHTLEFNTGPDGTPMNLKGGNVLKFPLGQENPKKEITAKIYLKDFKNVKPIERIVVVKPSCKPASMKLYYQADTAADPDVGPNETIISELRNKEEVEWTAGEMMKNITFKLYDEAGKLIRKPNIRKQDMKISWKRSEWVEGTGWGPHMLNDGKLPDVRSPREAGECLNCSITFFTAADKNQTDGFSFEFKVKSVPGPPHRIELSSEDGKGGKVLRLHAGEQMDLLSRINVKICDKHSNGVHNISEEDIEQLQVFCNTGTIIKGTLKKIKGDEDGEIYVSRIQFTNDTKLGTHALDFEYRGIKHTMTMELIHGIPNSLTWFFEPPINDNSGSVPVVKDSKFGFKLQVMDSFNNVCREEGIKVLVGSSPKLVLLDNHNKPIPKNMFTNKDGIADFGIFTVTVKEGELPGPCPALIACKGNCYGLLPVQAKAIVEVHSHGEKKAIESLKASLHVKCDSETPVDFKIDCDAIDEENRKLKNKIVAGSRLPMFKVSTNAEDGSPVINLGPRGVFMETMAVGKPDSKCRLEAQNYDGESGIYSFDYDAPQIIGNFLLKFGHQQLGSTVPMYCDPILFKVIPDGPASFDPVVPVAEPWVSNTSDAKARMIVSNLKFVLTDRFKNPIAPNRNFGGGDAEGMDVEEGGDDKYSGSLAAQIIGLNNEPIDTLPKFTGRVGFISYPIVNGECTIPTLELAEKSPGEDGRKYKITFTPKFNIPIMVKKVIPRMEANGGDAEEEEEVIEEPLKNYEMTFGFVNDVAKQEKMKKLTSRRSEITQKVADLMFKRDQIIKAIEDRQIKFNDSNMALKNFLNRNRREIDDSIDESSDPQAIRGLIRHKSALLEDAREGSDTNSQLPRFQIAAAPKEASVVGKIIHLAKVESLEASRVLSWHVRGDLNCIVTTTSDKARELDRRFHGNQQVWPITSINRRFHTSDPSSYPLPHTKCRNAFTVTGNPRWALSLITLEPGTEQSARIAFNSMFNNLLVMDSMDDATRYRDNCAQQGVDVGTILTLKDARRLSASGKYGGAGNNAPPLTDQGYKRFGMFALSPGHQELQLQNEINLLTNLEELAINRDELYKQWNDFKQSRASHLEAADRDHHKYAHEMKIIDESIQSFSRRSSDHGSTGQDGQRVPNGVSTGSKRTATESSNHQFDDDSDIGPSSSRRPRLETD